MRRDTAAARSAWLAAHPYRTADWLDARIAEGFDLHHVDCNPQNNVPGNLVLIEAGDHLALHNGSAVPVNFARLAATRPKKQGAPQRIDPIVAAARACREAGGTLDDNPHVPWGACYRQWRKHFLLALQAIDRMPVSGQRWNACNINGLSPHRAAGFT